MALTNSEYDAIMRHYDEIRENQRHEMEEREREVYAAIPEYEELQNRISQLSLEAARSRIADPTFDLDSYHDELARIADHRRDLLVRAGFSPDYPEMRYECPLCRDTGFIDGEPCSCFIRAQTEILNGRFGLAEVLEKENFDHFSFEWYSATMVDEVSGKTPRALAEYARSEALAFIRGIVSGSDSQNLYIYGTTGVGKTFLTHCIAREVLAQGLNVLYFSAGQLFDTLADAAFGRGGDAGRRMIEETDLLVIDDLGTELVNAFTSSELFRILNDRIRTGRATVISTNLSLQELSTLYSERIASRITSSFRMIRMAGEDIRILKVLR